MDCGHDPEELRHFAEGKHTYSEYRIFGTLSLVLCDLCQVDFGSYDPTYFGLATGTPIGFEFMSFVRDIVPPPNSFDRGCPECQRRRSFLHYVSAARELHQSNVT
jgi:hypothetical protein